MLIGVGVIIFSKKLTLKIMQSIRNNFILHNVLFVLQSRDFSTGGSYYEQMSNGTMVRIPNPDYSPVLSHKTLSNGSVIPPPDYT